MAAPFCPPASRYHQPRRRARIREAIGFADGPALPLNNCAPSSLVLPMPLAEVFFYRPPASNEAAFEVIPEWS